MAFPCGREIDFEASSAQTQPGDRKYNMEIDSISKNTHWSTHWKVDFV